MRIFFIASLLFSILFYGFSLSQSYLAALTAFGLTIIALGGAIFAELAMTYKRQNGAYLRVVK